MNVRISARFTTAILPETHSYAAADIFLSYLCTIMWMFTCSSDYLTGSYRSMRRTIASAVAFNGGIHVTKLHGINI